MITGINTQFAMGYSQQVARQYWNKLPMEDRTVLSMPDLAQDLMMHLITKYQKYDDKRDFKKWCRTVIYNKAISITERQWDEKIMLRQYYNPVPEGLTTAYVHDTQNGGSPELIYATEITPETILLNIEQEKRIMEGTSITIQEVQELCERFTIDFDSDDVLGSLIEVLSYTMGKITQEEFDALPDELQGKLATLSDALEAEKLSITSKKVGKQPKEKKQKGTKTQNEGLPESTGKTAGPGRGRRNEDGPVHHIREAFDDGNGIVNAAPMIIHLTKLGIPFSEATVRTQIGKLRKLYNLVHEGPGRGTAVKTGVVGTIRKNFDAGVITVPAMIELLTNEKLEFSPATVRTQMARLRKDAGLISDHKARTTELPANLGALIEQSPEITEVSL
jgi:DNA-directed RNA polymerase specialized sigma24 family protein